LDHLGEKSIFFCGEFKEKGRKEERVKRLTAAASPGAMTLPCEFLA
jgi:hypothetical protein